MARIKLIGLLFILLSLFLAYLCCIFRYAPEAYEIILPPNVNLPLAIICFLTGIGMLFIKNWARILSMILLLIFTIYAGFYARFFLSFTIFHLSHLQSNTKIFINSPPDNFIGLGPYITINITRDIIYPLACMSLIAAFLFLAYYLTRPKVKEQFKGKKGSE